MKLAVKVVALFTTLVFASALFGQAVSGSLVGTVTDKSGAVIPNAKVVATNVATGVSSTTVTTANGEFRFPQLPVGNYNITASATGFTSATLNNFPVELNRQATAQLVMDIGAVTTQVEVNA